MANVKNNIENAIPSVTLVSSSANRWSIIVTANDGYTLNDDITVKFTGPYGDTITKSLVVSADKKTTEEYRPLSLSSSTLFTFNGTTEATETVVVNNNIPNTTETHTLADGALTVNILCNDGYQIKGTPTLMYYDAATGFFDTVEFTVSDDKLTATAECNWFSEEVTLEGETEEKTVPVTITLNNTIEGTTADYIATSANNITITVHGTGEKGKTFVDPKVYYTNTKGLQAVAIMTVNDYIATVTITDGDTTQPFTTSGKYTEAIPIALNLTNCYATRTVPTGVFEGETLTVSIKPDTNNEWHDDDLPTIVYTDKDGYLHTVDGTITDNVGTVELVVPTGTQNITINAVCYVVEPVGGEYGAINVYVVTNDELSVFATKRFFKESSTDTSTGATLYESVDLGKYVNRIKRIYCNVDTKSTDIIKCGNYNTGVTCASPSSTVIEFSTGEVTIPLYNNSKHDYDNTQIQLYVPFGGVVSLPSYVCGKPIEIKFKVDIVAGTGIAQILCSGIDIQHVNITPSNDVLFRTSDMYGVIGAETWQSENLYGVDPVIITVHTEEIPTTLNNDCKTVSLSDCNGYCKFSDIVVNGIQCTETEQTELLQLLQSGIIL